MARHSRTLKSAATVTIAALGLCFAAGPGHAQSLLSVAIDACARGNMAACSQANALAQLQRQMRQVQGGSSSHDPDRRFHAQNQLNQGFAAQGQVYNDVYKHQLRRGY